MKKIIQYSVLIILIGSVGFSSCKKEKPITAIVTPPPPPLNYPPFADAGQDQTVNLACFDSASLDGRAYDDDLAGISYLWTLLPGLNQCNILNPASSKTAITGIIYEGIYRFRFQITDNKGAVGNDTIEVKAFRIPAGQEFVFENLIWTEGDINEVFTATPNRPDPFCDLSKLLEVSIKLANSNVWINVPESSNTDGGYYYIRYSSGLLIESDPADYSLVGTLVSIRVKFL